MQDRRAAGELTRPIDFLIERQRRTATITRMSGYVTLQFYERALCEAPELGSIHALAGPYLELIYTQRTVTNSDGL